MSTTELDRFISVTEAAKRLGVSYQRTLNLYLKNKLKGQRLPTPIDKVLIDARDITRVRKLLGRDDG